MLSTFFALAVTGIGTPSNLQRKLLRECQLLSPSPQYVIIVISSSAFPLVAILCPQSGFPPPSSLSPLSLTYFTAAGTAMLELLILSLWDRLPHNRRGKRGPLHKHAHPVPTILEKYSVYSSKCSPLYHHVVGLHRINCPF